MWVYEKMHELARRRGEPERAERILERYRTIEREVYATFVADKAALAPGTYQQREMIEI